MEVGQRGFFATCNFRDKECVRDCFKILNQFANQLYGKPGTADDICGVLDPCDQVPLTSEENPETDDENDDNEIEIEKAIKTKNQINAPAEGVLIKSGIKNDLENDTKMTMPKPNSDDEEEEDIATTLQKDIIATVNAYSEKDRRFQMVLTSVANCVFIKTTLPCPVDLGVRIVRNVFETKESQTKNILRLIPIEIVCKASMDGPQGIIDSAGRLCDKHFLNVPPTTFSIIYNKRYNNSINRNKLLQELADLVKSKNIAHKVDLKCPKFSLIVEVVKGLCLLSIIPDYMKLKRYNIAECILPNKTSVTNATENQALNSTNAIVDPKDHSSIDVKENITDAEMKVDTTTEG